MGPNVDFFWQHDARFRPGNRISMFDDGCCDLPDGAPEQVSHGLIIDLDFRSRKATVDRTYYHRHRWSRPPRETFRPHPLATNSLDGVKARAAHG
ncbi:arylsulfotransferase family protein [Streptomyces sp. NPDC051664]|uniref:arylsulfotransferase family protein n=1 Tax=Streptomyces sp. NPDC051664 TaxID=3365668 RepID=UPI0037B1E62C